MNARVSHRRCFVNPLFLLRRAVKSRRRVSFAAIDTVTAWMYNMLGEKVQKPLTMLSTETGSRTRHPTVSADGYRHLTESVGRIRYQATESAVRCLEIRPLDLRVKISIRGELENLAGFRNFRRVPSRSETGQRLEERRGWES